jgi:hypothetical protein
MTTPSSLSSSIVDLSAAQIAHLLSEFLISTQTVTLHTRIERPEELPKVFQPSLREAVSRGKAWTAWSTDRGTMAAWATYDREQSALLRAHVLFIDWFRLPDVHHAGWWHCPPTRHRDWTYGRGHPLREWR